MKSMYIYKFVCKIWIRYFKWCLEGKKRIVKFMILIYCIMLKVIMLWIKIKYIGFYCLFLYEVGYNMEVFLF